ncbi:MAG: signal peptide peptidase SppA [Chitinophagaceae bacterium]|nr:MAG: signal peptide peptidase SppA [Chitinophagaceae bacterium]
MKSFFKSFFASLLAIFTFFLLLFLFFFAVASALMEEEKTELAKKSVLVIDLSKSFDDKQKEDPFAEITGKSDDVMPSLSTTIQLINAAKSDSSINGIYLRSATNVNGYAASNELRNALISFKQSKKFIIAYGDYITQKAYYVANVSDKIYCHPKGLVEWQGMSVEYMFFKSLIDKLEIKPQIFYAGKFKSATEPFRESQMTEANKIQTTVWLNDLYDDLISTTSLSRRINADTLKSYANNYEITNTEKALDVHLIDGLKYDDEVKSEIRKKLGIADGKKINFISLPQYKKVANLKVSFSSDKIAVVVAEGEIVYGVGNSDQVSSDEYLTLLRKLRNDKSIKGIVLRVNSPGGSSLASEIIWREIELIKNQGKPVVVSMGDVAASGGYYISCNANTIFADSNTITGSIGVFSIVPDVSTFMKNKLGVTFDRVKTGAFADAPSVTRPMNDFEKNIMQSQVERVYTDFKNRVASGRNKSIEYVDSIAQGRVWTGSRAKQLGLVDQIGGLQEAIAEAVKLAKVKEYRIKTYPESKSFIDQILNQYPTDFTETSLKKELGMELYSMMKRIQQLKAGKGEIQTRIPFEFYIH